MGHSFSKIPFRCNGTFVKKKEMSHYSENFGVMGVGVMGVGVMGVGVMGVGVIGVGVMGIHLI